MHHRCYFSAFDKILLSDPPIARLKGYKNESQACISVCSFFIMISEHFIFQKAFEIA
jgi:hypothetical protein